MFLFDFLKKYVPQMLKARVMQSSSPSVIIICFKIVVKTIIT